MTFLRPVLGPVMGARGGDTIPSQSTALFWLDGTISGSEFVDKSGNERNFTITGKDFTASYFPYKTASTISAPVGDAVLIAADVNNFLYASDESPNEIPVVSFFQNIDYEDIGFCRHIAQVVDGNGVETTEPAVTDIVWYQSALTGADLTTANTYYSVPTKATSNILWVSKDGSDGDAGTEAAPKLTIDACQNAASSGDQIYVKSGNYDEIVYFDKNITITGIGLTQMVRTNHCFLTTVAAIAVVVEGFQMQTVSGFKCISITEALTSMTINRCYFTNTTASQSVIVNSEASSGTLTVNNAIINSGRIDWRDNKTFNGCIWGTYTSQAMLAVVATTSLNHCYLNESDSALGGFFKIGSLSPIMNVFDCEWYYNLVFNTASANSYTLNVDRCIGRSNATNISVFNNSVITGAQDITIENTAFYSNDVNGTMMNFEGAGDFVFNNNTINDLIGQINFTGVSAAQAAEIKGNVFNGTSGNKLYVESLVADIQNNVIDSGASGIHLVNDLASAQASIISNNVIIGRNASQSTPFIYVGLESDVSTYSKSDGTVVSNNVCYGARYFGEVVGGHHGVFIMSNAVTLSYNRIIGTFLAFVIKSNGAAEGQVLHHNTIIDCNSAWTVKGAQDVIIYNDTCVLTVLTDKTLGGGLQHLIETDYSTGLLFKNNIIADLRTDSDLNLFQTTADDMVDSAFDYNIYYKANGTKFCLYDAADTTIGTWQALPQDVNSIEDNPDFEDAANDDYSLAAGGGAIGAGDTLHADYDDGLDASTDWGDADTVPSVVTKQQTGSWDIGAYIS